MKSVSRLARHFGHVRVDALADPATGPDELQAGPDWAGPGGGWR